jgi:chromosome segregation ATPase
VEEENKKLGNQYYDSLGSIGEQIQVFENELKKANAKTKEAQTERDKISAEFWELNDLLEQADKKLSDAEEAINGVAKSLKLEFVSDATPAEKIEAIGEKDKENLKALCNAFGMNAKDFESNDVATIVENMKKNLEKLVKNKNDTAKELEKERKNLKEANEKVNALTSEIVEAGKAIDELGRTIENMKLDFSNVEIPKAYEGTPDKDADRRQARLEELRKRNSK